MRLRIVIAIVVSLAITVLVTISVLCPCVFLRHARILFNYWIKGDPRL